MSIELYGAPTGNCIRAAIALEEAMLPYTVRRVDLRLRKHREEEFLALNPIGQVPVIVDQSQTPQGVVLSQSNAIIFYAADRAPGRLMPDQDLAGRALVLERFFYFLTDIIAPSHAAFQLRVHGVNEGPEILDHQVMSRLRHAERFIAQTPFMAGDAFSIADIAAFTIAAPLGEHLQWRGLPNLERWFKSIQTRESVIRGYAAFGSW